MTNKRLIYLFIYFPLVTAELTFNVKLELGLIKWFVLTQVLVLESPPQPGFSQGLKSMQAWVSEEVCLACR